MFVEYDDLPTPIRGHTGHSRVIRKREIYFNRSMYFGIRKYIAILKVISVYHELNNVLYYNS